MPAISRWPVFSAQKTSDRACLACHDGPIHHADQVFTPKCPPATRNIADSRASRPLPMPPARSAMRTCGPAAPSPVKFVRDIENFGSGHPEFAALRSGKQRSRNDQAESRRAHEEEPQRAERGAGAARLRRLPPAADFDRCLAVRFGRADRRRCPLRAEVRCLSSQKSDLAAMVLARAYMAPPTYAKTCVACHGLQFDKRFTEGVPHDTPDVVHKFLVREIRAIYCRASGGSARHRARSRAAAEAAAGCGANSHSAAVGHGARGGIRAAALRQDLQAVPRVELFLSAPRFRRSRNRTSRRAGCRTRISITTGTSW